MSNITNRDSLTKATMRAHLDAPLDTGSWNAKTEDRARIVSEPAWHEIQRLRNEWQPLKGAPRNRVVLLLVGFGKDRKVFVAMADSSTAKKWHWNITTGWNTWVMLHESYVPINWMALPEPPEGVVP